MIRVKEPIIGAVILLKEEMKIANDKLYERNRSMTTAIEAAAEKKQ